MAVARSFSSGFIVQYYFLINCSAAESRLLVIWTWFLCGKTLIPRWDGSPSMTRPILLSKQRQESLHICDFDVAEWHRGRSATLNLVLVALAIPSLLLVASVGGMGDRKSTRLNSSHLVIS